MPREHRERPLSPLSWGRYQQCLLHSEPLLTGAGASQELEEVTAASRGRSAEAHRARLTRQWETTEGAGKTVLPEGELIPVRPVALEPLVGPHAVPIRVPPPRPRGLLAKVPSRRGCWKVRGREVSPRRRWLLRESVWRTRNSCGPGPRGRPGRS